MPRVDQSVNLSERTVLGKGLNKLRQDGLVPAVIHNHGQTSIHVMAQETELLKVYREAGKHHPLNLQVGSDKYLALIKDMKFNPVKHRLQHVVFQAIRATEKTEAEIPIRLEGEIPAEKVGLLVLTQLDAVQVEALPRDLPDELVADATKLAELHDKIIVSDLAIPSGVTVLTEAEHPIATVVETKAQMSEEAEAAETEGEEEAAEGAPEAGAQDAEQTGEAGQS
jgi:large subunit ribosomal protein L25